MTSVISLAGMTFYDKVRYLREKEGLPQSGLAERLRTSQSRIWQLENPQTKGGKRNVDPALIFKISEYFNVPVRWLLDDRLEVEHLSEMRSDYQDLTEAERQIMVTVRVLGPKRALARLLGVDEPTGSYPVDPAPPKGVAEAKHLKTVILGQSEPERPTESAVSGNADSEPVGPSGGKKKKPRPPK